MVSDTPYIKHMAGRVESFQLVTDDVVSREQQKDRLFRLSGNRPDKVCMGIMATTTTTRTALFSEPISDKKEGEKYDSGIKTCHDAVKNWHSKVAMCWGSPPALRYGLELHYHPMYHDFNIGTKLWGFFLV